MHAAAPALPFRREDGPGVFQSKRWRRPRTSRPDAQPFHCHLNQAHRWGFDMVSTVIRIGGVPVRCFNAATKLERCKNCGIRRERPEVVKTSFF